LGAVQATAVDIDPIAESIAYENAEMNGIGRDGYRVLIGNVLDDLRIQREISGQYPVVAANIVADVIIALAPLARTLVQPGGVFLVSGIIDERVDEVVQALNNSGFAIAEHSRAEGWNAFLCR
jgi:ribosomal protein L11 methyltransferase